MVRDMDVEIRVSSFNALGKIPTVSENILLQTLSKKALPSTKEIFYPGQYTAKLSKIPAAAAAFAFLHGLEDEFFQVLYCCFSRFFNLIDFRVPLCFTFLFIEDYVSWNSKPPTLYRVTLPVISCSLYNLKNI